MRNNSYRDKQQRFHKGRQGSILVPHAALSGLLFTVNPRQEPRALREAQLFLSGLTEDLRAAHEKYLAKTAKGGGRDDKDSSDDDEGTSGEDGEKGGHPDQPHATTSSLLAAELAEAMESHRQSRKRHRADSGGSEESVEKGEGKPHQQKRPPLSQKWFASLETSCKGYMLVNIPSVNPLATCVVCRAGGSNEESKTEATVADGKTTSGVVEELGATEAQEQQLPPHSIVINPLVSHVVERVFADLLGRNASPVFRHCFRLMPVELTCCPTMPEMQEALRKLLAMHFPLPSSTTAMAPAEGSDRNDELTFEKSILLAQPVSHLSTSQPVKHMFTIALNFNVKNNTNVEAKKQQFQSQLQGAIPMNRFITVAPSLLAQKKVTVDAVLCVNVIHATCVMGVQRLYEQRRGYNLHDLSEEKLELSNSIQPANKKDE